MKTLGTSLVDAKVLAELGKSRSTVAPDVGAGPVQFPALLQKAVPPAPVHTDAGASRLSSSSRFRRTRGFFCIVVTRGRVQRFNQRTKLNENMNAALPKT